MRDDNDEKELFLDKNEINNIFDSKYDLNINLFRGRNPNNDDPILYPILKSFLMSNNKVRNADIKTYMKNGVLWINSKSGGVSLFDALGYPVKSWDYYVLPIGTKIPHGLMISRDDYHKKFKCYHYSIRAQWDMTVEKFCHLLDELTKSLRGV